MIGIIDTTIELEIGQEMAMEIGEMMSLKKDKITEDIIIDRIMVTKGIEIGVQVRIAVDPGPDIRVIHGIIQIQEMDTVIIETKAEVEIEGKGLEVPQEKEKVDLGQIQDLGPVLVSALKETDSDATDAVNMITCKRMS